MIAYGVRNHIIFIGYGSTWYRRVYGRANGQRSQMALIRYLHMVPKVHLYPYLTPKARAPSHLAMAREENKKVVVEVVVAYHSNGQGQRQ